jgi:phenylacetate-CoA ligase
MNKNYFKDIRDKMPEFFKYLFASVFRNKLLKNSHYFNQRKLLKERETLTEEQINSYQFNQIKYILNYAFKYVPYYANLFDQIGFQPDKIKSADDIQVIPFLTKTLIRDNFKELISTEKVSGGHYVATTGGSTGEPLKILLDYNSVFKENAFINHFRSKIGYSDKDKLATFRGVEFGDKLWKFNPMQNELILSPFKLSKSTLRIYLKRINKYKPNYLNGYLSSIYFFAQLLSDNNLEIKCQLKGVFLISENIDIEQRNFIDDFFKVKSATFYGHSERCIIAEEIEPNLYTFDPYYGYTELIENVDSSFSIVGTGFLNKTMPLIRYKTDDKCEIYVKEKVSILGRWHSNDFLIGINDEKVFHSAFNFHSDIFQNVTGYQFIQKVKGKAEFLITVNSRFKDTEIRLMQNEIQKKTKDVVNFEINVVESFVLSKRGKFKMFVSKIRV